MKAGTSQLDAYLFSHLQHLVRKFREFFLLHTDSVCININRRQNFLPSLGAENFNLVLPRSVAVPDFGTDPDPRIRTSDLRI